MNYISEKNQFFKENTFLIIVFSLVSLLIHFYVNVFAGYGIFRDELYYIACSNRPALGYVDHPPLSIYLLGINRFLFGESLFAIRLIPAITSSILVSLTGLMVREMNGGKTAIAISSLTVISAPILLAMHTVYSMNCISILLWSLAFYILFLMIKDNKTKYWVYLGFIIGLGLLNKIDFLWFCFGLFFGLLLTPMRKNFLTKKPYISALIALILFLPYIIWNFNNDFAHLEFIRNASSGKYSGITRLDFVLGSILIMNPISLFIWLPGLYYYFFDKGGKTFRIHGIIFVTVFTILFINGHSKPEYLSPAYPILFVAGAILVENYIKRKNYNWIKYALIIFILISGTLISPFTLPILPVENYIEYAKNLGIEPSSNENKKLSELPQFYSDMFGWENLAKTVSEIYCKLSPEDKKETIIYASNYGKAGAIEYFSNKYELPPVISPHNNYWIWGKETIKNNFNIVIIIGGKIEDHLHSLEEVTQVGFISDRYSMPYENNLPVYIGRKLKINLKDILKADKNFS